MPGAGCKPAHPRVRLRRWQIDAKTCSRNFSCWAEPSDCCWKVRSRLLQQACLAFSTEHALLQTQQHHCSCAFSPPELETSTFHMDIGIACRSQVISPGGRRPGVALPVSVAASRCWCCLYAWRAVTPCLSSDREDATLRTLHSAPGRRLRPRARSARRRHPVARRARGRSCRSGSAGEL